MSPSRRTLLKAGVPVALGGAGLGYWQRRRIRRRDDLEPLEEAAALETPTVGEPVATSDAIVQAGHEDARAHLEHTEELAADVPEETTVPGLERRLDQAADGLEANPPGAAETDGDRLETLQSYRLAMANSGSARGAISIETQEEDGAREALRVLVDEATAVRDALEISYEGDPFTTAIVQYGAVDQRVTSASSRLGRLDDRTISREEPNPVHWESVAVSRFDLETAARYLEELDGPELTEALESGYESLADRTESIVEETEFVLEDDVRNYTTTVWRHLWDSERPAENAHESGRVARALRDQSQALAIAHTLEEFVDVPEFRAWDEREEDVPRTGVALHEAAAAAAVELEDTLEVVGDDPLGRLLLEEPARDLENVQSRADRLRDDVRSIADDDWTRRIAQSALRCRRAGAYAAAVPGVLDEVRAFDPV